MSAPAIMLAALVACTGAEGPARSVVDLGRVDPPFTEPVQASVPVRNDGPAGVAIDRAVPHCAGCTRVASVPRSIPPGAGEEVRFLLEPGRSRGRLRFGATLLSGGAPWAVAEVTMLVPGIDAGAAGTIDLGTVEPGEVIERAIPVRVVAPVGAHCEVRPDGASLRATLEEEPGPPAMLGHGLEERRARLIVAVATDPGAADGPVPASVEITLQDRGRRIDRVRVEVRASVMRPSAAEPAALFVAAISGGDVRAMEVSLPSWDGDDIVAAGARVLSVERQDGAARVLVRPDAQPDADAGPVRRGTVVLRWSGREQRIPWLGFDLRPGGPLPSPAQLGEIIAFKRDSICASTSSSFEDTAIASELLRSPAPEPLAAGGIRIRRWIHRSHDGCLRATAIRREGSGDVDVTVSDGRSEARCVGDGPPIVREGAAGSGHPLRAEWEAIAGMLGSVARGTARDGLEDLAEALEREPPGGVEIGWDHGAVPGRPLLRVGIGRSSPMRLWLDPALGLAVVIREQVVDDGVSSDGVRWEATDFFRVASGIELPRTFRSVQVRKPSRADDAPGTTSRIVLEQTMRCLAFRIDAPSGDADPVPEQSVGRVRLQALSVWDGGRPRKDRSP